VLHFGTLYYLPNPVPTLQITFDNLRPGGYLALETQVYDHPEHPNICYSMHMRTMTRPTWALSTSVMTKWLELLGFREIRDLFKVVPQKGLARHMARIILVGPLRLQPHFG
jgi:hypothetical protein